MQSLPVNPLLLTMIAMVHRYRGALPGSRVELYREMCAVFLGRRRQSLGVKEWLNADQKQDVLQVLAARMMETNDREIEKVEALAIIQPELKSLGLTDAEADSFLEYIRDSSGLLLEREAGLWGFAHKTFQQYLTSAFGAAKSSCRRIARL